MAAKAALHCWVKVSTRVRKMMFSPFSSMEVAYCWRASVSKLFATRHLSRDSMENIFPLRLECEERGFTEAVPSVFESSKGFKRF